METTTTATGAVPDIRGAAGASRWLILAVLGTAQFMLIIDLTEAVASGRRLSCVRTYFPGECPRARAARSSCCFRHPYGVSPDGL